MTFAPILAKARAWLAEPAPESLGALIELGESALPAVPEMRRADWQKLLAGMSGKDPRPRVEGLVRACRLFDKKIEALSTVDALPGLGGMAKSALAEHGLRTVADLVWLPPRGWDDFRKPVSLRDAIALSPARVVCAAVVKASGLIPMRGRRIVRVVLQDADDEKCTLHAFWFFMAHGVLEVCKPGTAVLATLKATVEPKKPPRCAHPEIVLDEPRTRVVRARYPRLGPNESALRKAVFHAVTRGVTPDPVPPAIAEREAMTDASKVICSVHAIDGHLPDGATQRAFLERLAWSEAFTRVWERIAVEPSKVKAPALKASPKTEKAIEKALGFAFTAGQRNAIREIAKDISQTKPMRRLLLGDVGTGKTAVALVAAAQCIRAGKTAAILAPTSVLAEQYLSAVKPLLEVTQAKLGFFAAGSIRASDPDLAIGTHALLGDRVSLPRLGLVIVDEQQRLGVAQRLSLVKKGVRPHLLTLSATPIPRTLSLALRGELLMSKLDERPAGRPPVATSKSHDRAAALREAKANEGLVFWVVPRIEADEDDEDQDELATLEERAKELRAAGLSIETLHGKMKSAEKSAAMTAFREGRVKVLVSTTVVEVGVDVPEATLMVIEAAERFGLAQLHQLRGRVGRGASPGRAILLHSPDPTEAARARIDALCRLSDGEDIAKADLDLRGAGDLGGTRQHGDEEELRFLDPAIKYGWLERIEEDARSLFATDPALEAHTVLRSLVKRLGHAIAVREEAG